MGNSSTYLPTTEWQQAEIYLGNLSAGNHTIILGGYNNKKDASDESTTFILDDVLLTNGNSNPVTTDAQTLVGRVSISQFLSYNQGVAQFNDRCHLTGCGTTDITNAQNWVQQQLEALGYTVTRHNFTYNGYTGTNIWATKLGTTNPTQMYMISAHLDGRGGGDGFDDDGSGSALVLEAARVYAGSDVQTDKSVRFILWDHEESGLNGAYAYVRDRKALQGSTSEPTWLGIVQHDMILYDHGAGSVTTAQSAYADLDVEWRAGTTKAADLQTLAMNWRFVEGIYAPDYPANAYNYSTNTDDTPFHNEVASVSVRENRRILTSGANAEWINPYYHTTNDVESSYTRDDDGDGKRDDIELGYNAVRTTVGLIAELAGVNIINPNSPPTSNAQSVMTNEDTAIAITLTGSDPDNDPLTFSVVNNPSHGTLSGTAPSLTYTPAGNYNGADSFTFKVNDGTQDSAPATVSITVNPVNDPPVANSQSISTNCNTSVVVLLGGNDVDNDPLSFSVTGSPIHGSLSGTAPSLTYTPATGYSGGDSL